MSVSLATESGLQLLSRLTVRPKLEDINNKIFPHGLTNKGTIELCGNSSSGKSLLLTQLIAKCILISNDADKEIGGLKVGVLLINNDQHIKIMKLAELMIEIMKKNNVDEEKFNKIIEQSFLNLTIINCYNNSQFSVASETLNTILLNNDKIGLVVVDSMTAFYWQDRECGKAWVIDDYVKNYLKIIQKHTFQANIPIIYTRPSDIMSNLKETISQSIEPIIGKINGRIELRKNNNETKKFTCFIEKEDTKTESEYEINSCGIRWIEDDEKKEINLAP